MAVPGGGVRREHYDFLGKLLRSEEPDGTWLRYRYGREGRLERVDHSAGEYVEFGFDAARNEWSARTPRTEVRVRLSGEGLPTESLHTIDGCSWGIGYRRDAFGRVEACRYPGSEEWTTPERYLTIERDSAARRVVVRFPNGTMAEEEMAGDRLTRITVRDARAATVVDASYEYDGAGRLAQAGPGRASYTAGGQLRSWNSRSYEYDAQGRLVAIRSGQGTRRLEYGEGPTVRRAGAVEFAYDACGRRIERRDQGGTTRFRYNMLGQLAEVGLPDGRVLRYLYDGFGRLVARTADGIVTYYIVDLDGRRLAEAGTSGRISRSYVWLGPSCVGRTEGVIGGELSCSFHRLHSGWLAAIGDAHGRVRRVSLDDPFGSATPIQDGVPGYGGLFGDPQTCLLHAGSRWLDPATAQFLTPDSWAGLDVARWLPARLRRVVRSMPGGPGQPLTPVTAYAWCAYDPVNFNDPTGHSWAGFILPTLSAFLWEVNLTNIAYQMELINVVWTFLLFVIGGSKWAPNVFEKTSIFNTLGGAASSRQHVWAFVFNGLLNLSSVAWTLGSVIWARGTDFQEISEEAQRDLLICPRAGASYHSALGERTADLIRALSTTAVLSGQVQGVDTSPAGGGILDSVAVTTPAAGAALADVLRPGDWISVSPPVGGNRDEVRRVANLVPPDVIHLDGPPLPVGFAPAAPPAVLTVTRLDQGVVRVREGTHVVARTVVFVRGDAIHIPRQVPKEFGKAIAVDEYFPAGVPRRLELPDPENLPLEPMILRKATKANWAGYVVNTFIRIQSGKDFFPRVVARLRGADDLVLDSALPAGDYKNLKTAQMVSRAVGVPVPPNTTVVNQATVGVRTLLTAGDNVTGLKDLKPQLGLEITNAGGAVERRLAKELAVRCATDPINDAALLGVAIEVDNVRAAGGAAKGQMDGATAREIVTDPGKATAFKAAQPVQVTNVANAHTGLSVVDHVDAPNDRVFLTEALRAADFGTPNTDVEIEPLKPFKKHTARSLAAAGDPLIVVVPAGGTPGSSVKQGEILRVRLKAARDGGVVRLVPLVPTILVTLDTLLPASHAAAIDLTQFEPGAAATERSGVSAPRTRQRLAIPVGTPVPYVANDILWIRGFAEEAWVEVDRVTGQDVFFKDLIDLQRIGSPLTVMRLEPTGATTPNATMDQGRVLVPSDPAVELTRTQALKEHELRHVRQGAAWGPLLLSAPIPWLVSVGVGLAGSGAAGGSKVTRWLKVGGLYSALAEIVWGIGTGLDGSTIVRGTVTDRRTIVLAADADIQKVSPFAERAHVQIFEGGNEGANIVERLDAASRTLTLKRELEDNIATGADVEVGFDPLEEWRLKLSSFPFALNPEPLWADALPNTWLKLLSKVLNSEEWLPGLGVYPLAWLIAHGDRDRIPAEQDAAFHSGDLYNTIVLSDPAEVFVGEFSRLFTFVHIRNSGISRDVRYVGAGIAARIHHAVPAGPPESIEILNAGVINRFRSRQQPILIRDSAKPTKEVSAWIDRVTPATSTIRVGRSLAGDFPDLRNVRVSFLTYAATGGLSRLAVELPIGITDGKVRDAARKEIEITRTKKDQGIEITREEMPTHFLARQSVRITMAGTPPEFAVIESIKSKEHRIVLREPLPNAFAAGTDVEIVVVVDDTDVPEALSEIVSINGEMNGASLKEIKFPTIPIAPFAKKDPVRILRSGDALNLMVPAEVEAVEDLDVDHDTIVLKKALPAAFVAGTRVRVLGGRVGFREDRRFKMKDRVENAVGFLFRAVKPGVYSLIAPDTPTKELVWKRGFDVDFLKLAKVRVKPLEITTSLPAPLFETEQMDVKIRGRGRNYDLELVPIPGGDAGTLNRNTYTAPRIAAGNAIDVEFRVFATYAVNDPILGSAGKRGQAEPLRLRPDELRFLCQQFKLTIRNLDREAPVLAAIRAGQTTTFQMPIPPSDVQVVPRRGPGSTRDAFVTRDGKRPSKLVFHAPDRVTASTNFTIDLVFGHDPDPARRKTVPVPITVDP